MVAKWLMRGYSLQTAIRHLLEVQVPSPVFLTSYLRCPFLSQRFGCGRRRRWVLVAALAGCSQPAGSGALADRNDLEAMAKASISINGYLFEVWLAGTPEQQRKGLMQVTDDQLAPFFQDSGQAQPVQIERGMLFVFPTERPLSFWMYNTIIPLDIAYIRGDGVIVSIATMAPRETRCYPSVEPAQFALEVRAGLLARLGIKPGDSVEIPESVLKAAS